MSEETKKAPAIRFQGFTDDWEQRKLREVGNVVTGSTPSTLDKTNYNGSYLFVSPADIQGNRYVDKTITTLSEKGFRKGRILKEGAILFVSIGSTIGKVAQIRQEAVTNQQINAVVPHEDYDDNFIFSSLVKESEKIRLLSATQAVPIINKTTFSNIDIHIPGNIKEQIQIGAFFNKMDDTIALHLCKQRQLELLKQRLIKEILPQSDSTLPHLRFANFRKPWEQHQLKEVLKVNSGRDYKHLNEGNIPVYGTGGYMLSVDGKLSDVDGIGLGRKGTIDKPQYLKAPFWTVDTLFYLTPSPNYDIYFLYTLIQNVNWKSMDESTGVPSLSKSVIERVTLTFPILEEQQKIGSFFREFDNTISLHQQKIAHLKALKSTILNKMFI